MGTGRLSLWVHAADFTPYFCLLRASTAVRHMHSTAQNSNAFVLTLSTHCCPCLRSSLQLPLTNAAHAQPSRTCA